MRKGSESDDIRGRIISLMAASWKAVSYGDLSSTLGTAKWGYVSHVEFYTHSYLESSALRIPTS